MLQDQADVTSVIVRPVTIQAGYRVSQRGQTPDLKSNNKFT